MIRLVLSPQVEDTVRATGSCLMAGKTGKEEYARLLGELFAIEEEKEGNCIKVTKELTAVKT